MTTVRTRVLRGPTGSPATTGQVSIRSPHDQTAPDGTTLAKGLAATITLTGGAMPGTDLPPGNYEVQIRINNTTRSVNGTIWFPIVVPDTGTVYVEDAVDEFTQWTPPVVGAAQAARDLAVTKAAEAVEAAAEAAQAAQRLDQAMAGAPSEYDTFVEIAQKITADDTALGALNSAITAKYSLPGTGVPKSDLDPGVRSSLDKADAAITKTIADGSYAPRGTYVRTTGAVAGPGILDWGNDSTDGYAVHLTLGSNSGTSVAAMGIGTDAGSGSGIIVSHKNAGRAIDIGVQPTASHGMQITGRSAAGYIARFLAKAGALGVTFKAEAGAGYADGVTTAGSTTLTSATAAFTAADVGKTLTQTASRASAPTGTLPAGVTVASVTNATTVVMSAPATATASGLMFEVGSRMIPDSQALLTVQGEDSASYTQVSKQGILARGTLASIAPLRARRKAGQTAAIQTWEDETGVALSMVGPNGLLMSKVTTTPTAADLSASTMALSLDATAGAPKLVVTAKDSAGTLYRASIPMTSV